MGCLGRGDDFEELGQVFAIDGELFLLTVEVLLDEFEGFFVGYVLEVGALFGRFLVAAFGVDGIVACVEVVEVEGDEAGLGLFVEFQLAGHPVGDAVVGFGEVHVVHTFTTAFVPVLGGCCDCAGKCKHQ